MSKNLILTIQRRLIYAIPMKIDMTKPKNTLAELTVYPITTSTKMCTGKVNCLSNDLQNRHMGGCRAIKTFTSQVPRFGAWTDAGGPCEYLHWPHAEHLSNFTLFSNVQNLQDQILYLVRTSSGFCVLQSSHIGANGCSDTPSFAGKTLMSVMVESQCGLKIFLLLTYFTK